MREYKKYFTLSYDDGLEQDKQIIDLLKKYGIRATFNLNSGLFGSKEKIEYIGKIGYRCVDESVPMKRGFIKTARSWRIPEDEIKQVYEGFELATHSVTHPNLTKLPEKELDYELLTDRERLQRYTDIPVVGHAYPSGATNSKVETVLKENGFCYARTVMNTAGPIHRRFAFPDDPLRWNPTCWHINNNVEKLLDMFLNATENQGDMVFYMWGHGYELDFETMKRKGFMTKFERMLDKVACADTVIKCTNAEAIKAHFGNCTLD